MKVKMECGECIELNKCDKVDIRETSTRKWMLYTVTADPIDGASIGVFANLHEAAAALESLRLFIKKESDWNFHEYVRGQYN